MIGGSRQGTRFRDRVLQPDRQAPLLIGMARQDHHPAPCTSARRSPKRRTHTAEDSRPAEGFKTILDLRITGNRGT